jgi:hypothetical protein
MACVDTDADAVTINGKAPRRVLRRRHTYETGGGEVVVERTLYGNRTDADDASVPWS